MKAEDLNDAFLRSLLEKHPAPAPDDEKKQEHIANAVTAFEKKMQKKAMSTQGSAPFQRLIETINQKGSMFMSIISGKHRASVAFASLAIAALGVTTAMYMAKDGLNGNFSDISSEVSQPDAPKERRVAETELQKVAKPELVAPPAPPPVIPELPPRLILPESAQNDMAVASPPPVANRMAAQTGAAGFAVAESAMLAPGMDYYPQQPVYQGHDRFEQVSENPVKSVAAEPVSTFSIDVDTASYSFIRRQISQGIMPTPDAVRIEEMINYFPYNYPLPETRREPFKPSVAVYPTPWNADTRLLHIGIKGYDIARSEAPRSNLVFLIDTSGSMQGPDRLPLLINCLKMLLETLDEDDTVGIVTYAGYSGVALEPTKVKEKDKILDVLNRLGAGGSTAGAQGIETAYQLAGRHFDKEAVNRVILATDGDFNVGMSDPQQLKRVIEQKRQSGIFLSVLGFGQGNYNDALMQKLAQNGNGTAAYIDTLSEGRKVLVEEATSALFPIAKDVKVQIEFNPAQVAEYRLIGYETRHLNREDFNNDRIDAGELGAGHTVTAIYEITPTGSKAQKMDDLRYGSTQEEVAKPASGSNEIAFLKLRYKLPNEDTSRLIERPITQADSVSGIARVDSEARFATAVAAFGQKLKGSAYVDGYSYDDLIALAEGARGEDRFGYRAEFVNLVRLAKSQGVSNTYPQPAPQPMPTEVPAPGLTR